jgi:hypothetical protein
METYKPAQTPIVKKILFSPFLHVAIIFLLVFATITFIRQRQKEELRARVEYLKGGPVLVERNQPAPAPTPTQSQTTTAPNPDTTANAAATAGADKPASAPGSNPTASATATSESLPASPAAGIRAASLNAPANRAAPNRAVIIYAEIDRGVLNTWVNEMRTSGRLRNFDSVTMGPLPQISQKMKNPGVKILQQLEFSLLNSTSPYEWFSGTHRGSDPDNEMGFFSSLVVGDLKDGLIRGEIEVQRAFRDPSDPAKTMERVSFGGPFEMPNGSGFVMRGLLPSKYSMDASDDGNVDPFMSVLKSRGFRTEETEFALILDFDNGGPQNK